jgi:hypothetical protein
VLVLPFGPLAAVTIIVAARIDSIVLGMLACMLIVLMPLTAYFRARLVPFCGKGKKVAA